MKKLIAIFSICGMLLGIVPMVFADTQGSVAMTGQPTASFSISITTTTEPGSVPVDPPAIDWGQFALNSKLSTWVCPSKPECNFYTIMPQLYSTVIHTPESNTNPVNLSWIGTDATSTGGGLWTLSSSAGANAFALHETTGRNQNNWNPTPVNSLTYTNITGEGQGLNPGGSMVLDFFLDTPTSSAKFSQFSFGITVLAVAP